MEKNYKFYEPSYSHDFVHRKVISTNIGIGITKSNIMRRFILNGRKKKLCYLKMSKYYSNCGFLWIGRSVAPNVGVCGLNTVLNNGECTVGDEGDGKSTYFKRCALLYGHTLARKVGKCGEGTELVGGQCVTSDISIPEPLEVPRPTKLPEVNAESEVIEPTCSNNEVDFPDTTCQNKCPHKIPCAIEQYKDTVFDINNHPDLPEANASRCIGTMNWYYKYNANDWVGHTKTVQELFDKVRAEGESYCFQSQKYCTKENITGSYVDADGACTTSRR